MTDPKQAAERLKPYIDSDWPASMWAQFESDCHTLARAYLAEHADDDVAIKQRLVEATGQFVVASNRFFLRCLTAPFAAKAIAYRIYKRLAMQSTELFR